MIGWSHRKELIMSIVTHPHGKLTYFQMKNRVSLFANFGLFMNSSTARPFSEVLPLANCLGPQLPYEGGWWLNSQTFRDALYPPSRYNQYSFS